MPQANMTFAEMAHDAVSAHYTTMHDEKLHRVSDEDIAELLAHLRFLCDREGFDFGQTDKLAYSRYLDLKAVQS